MLTSGPFTSQPFSPHAQTGLFTRRAQHNKRHRRALEHANLHRSACAFATAASADFFFVVKMSASFLDSLNFLMAFCAFQRAAFRKPSSRWILARTVSHAAVAEATRCCAPDRIDNISILVPPTSTSMRSCFNSLYAHGASSRFHIFGSKVAPYGVRVYAVKKYVPVHRQSGAFCAACLHASTRRCPGSRSFPA